MGSEVRNACVAFSGPRITKPRINIYIYMCVCVCVCVDINKNTSKEGWGTQNVIWILLFPQGAWDLDTLVCYFLDVQSAWPVPCYTGGVRQLRFAACTSYTLINTEPRYLQHTQTSSRLQQPMTPHRHPSKDQNSNPPPIPRDRPSDLRPDT